MDPDHLVLRDRTTERVVAIRADQSVEPIGSLGMPDCSHHAWSDNDLLAFPVRNGRRLHLWSVAGERAARLATSDTPLDVQALVWWRERFVIGGRQRSSLSALWALPTADATVWQPVALSPDIPAHEATVHALQSWNDTLIAALGNDLLVRLEIHDGRAQLWASHRLANTWPAKALAVRTGTSLCAVWTRQQWTVCRPRPSANTWNSVTLHRAESLELLGGIDVPDDLTDLVFVGDNLFMLAGAKAWSYSADALLSAPLRDDAMDWLFGAEPLDVPATPVHFAFAPTSFRRSRGGAAYACSGMRSSAIRDMY